MRAIDFPSLLAERFGTWVFEVPPGEIVLSSSREDLWRHPHIRAWHEFIEKYWVPEPRPLAVIMPCTSVKPYGLSATHRLLDARLRRLGLYDQVSKYTISEPMILVPRELELYYPFANYDYPPSTLTPEGRRRFVELLATALRKVVKHHRAVVAVLPRHHESVLRDSLRLCGPCREHLVMVPYGRLAFRSVAKAVDILRSLLG